MLKYESIKTEGYSENGKWENWHATVSYGDGYLPIVYLHREDGPAIIYYWDHPAGRYHWVNLGHTLSFKEWCLKLDKSDEEIVELKLKYYES